MLAQITLPAKWSYAPVTVKFVSYAPAPTEHPPRSARKSISNSPEGAPLRGGAVSLPSKAEQLAVERLASSPSKIEGVAACCRGRMKVTMTDRGV